MEELEIRSSAFEDGGEMPARYTCEGEDLSPPLEFRNVPAGTSTLALIVDDPDAPDPAAPQRVWVHWVVYNIPAEVRELAEGASGSMPDGCVEGMNDSDTVGYSGPCPPIGRHRYFHKLYALDIRLPDDGPITKEALTAAMKGHILATSELIGTYQKKT